MFVRTVKLGKLMPAFRGPEAIVIGRPKRLVTSRMGLLWLWGIIGRPALLYLNGCIDVAACVT